MKQANNPTEKTEKLVEDLQIEKDSILKGARLNWVHWLVVALSLVLTFSAWYFSKSQIEEKIKFKFDRQVASIIDLVKERMDLYEGSLWGGVAAIRLNDDKIDNVNWLKFADSLEIEKKYPGISGIGIIYKVLPRQMPAYLEAQRKNRPEYKIHPKHNETEFWPITYIEPFATNQKAVGLDMAHETNRFTAAKKARDTGQAQITGPIVLVQDSGKTPGFLFYAPFYRGGRYTSLDERQERFSGLVYAPFVVKRLMEGALKKTKRQIGFRIKDGDEILFDEHNRKFEDFDPDPLFKTTINLDVYGRNWVFDLWSAKSFRNASTSTQPLLILFGGLFIDTLLLILFVLLSKSNHRAIDFAERVTKKLKEKTVDLEKSNIELEQFAYRTSHDLLSPLKSIMGLTRYIEKDLKNKAYVEVEANIFKVDKLAEKLTELVGDILNLSKADHLDESNQIVDLPKIEGDIRDRLSVQLNEAGVVLRVESTQPLIFRFQQIRLTQILENLISNGIKYCDKSKTERFVDVKVTEQNGNLHIDIQDNGIGIPAEHQNHVFSMFKRFHPAISYGSGLGLYLVKKHIDQTSSSIDFISNTSGTTFNIVLKKGDAA